MNTIDSIIENVKVKDKASLTEAVNQIVLMTESELAKNHIGVGDTVFMADDPTYPSGGYGTVRSIDEEHGYAEVEWPNGVKVRSMLSLLYPVKKA